jgi:hypothetical protein
LAELIGGSTEAMTEAESHWIMAIDWQHWWDLVSARNVLIKSGKASDEDSS